jgi:hypothetical protein
LGDRVGELPFVLNYQYAHAVTLHHRQSASLADALLERC